MAAERANHSRELRGPGRCFRRTFRRVANPQSAPGIKVAERDASTRKLAHKSNEARQCAAVRCERHNLRADMRADSLPVDPAGTPMLQVEPARRFPIDSKFVAMMSGGNVRMATGNDVRIDADGRRSAHSHARRFGSKQIKLCGRLHIEEKNAREKPFSNFFARFSDARENDAASWHATPPETIKFSAGNNVEPATEGGKHAQNAQIRIGFYRVANRMRQLAKRGIHAAVGLLDARPAVEVRRGSKSLRGVSDGHTLAIQLRPPIRKSRSIARRIDNSGGARSTRRGGRRAHLAFITTSARSSVMAPPCVKS